MRIKSFFAASVDAALADARRELGPEAVLIQSRPAPPEARSLGLYEVVCALLPPESAEKSSALPPREAKQTDAAAKGDQIEQLKTEIEALRGTVERLQSSVARNQTPVPPGPPDHLEVLRAALTDAELDAELATAVLERTAAEEAELRNGTPAHHRRPADIAKRHLAQLIETESSLGAGSGPQMMVALVGPPGAGKTSCIAKLAAHYGVSARRATEIIAVDECRVGATEQLRSYAAILGAGFRLVTANDDLRRALEDCRWKNLVLVDTPGFGFAEADACRELGTVLSSQSSLEVHLVLPCSMRAADLRRVCEFYAPFRAQRLIFTRLDETRAYGSIVNEAVRICRPVSFLTAGTSIPEDIEEANGERIAELILGAQVPEARALAAAM